MSAFDEQVPGLEWVGSGGCGQAATLWEESRLTLLRVEVDPGAGAAALVVDGEAAVSTAVSSLVGTR